MTKPVGVLQLRLARAANKLLNPTGYGVIQTEGGRVRGTDGTYYITLRFMRIPEEEASST